MEGLGGSLGMGEASVLPVVIVGCQGRLRGFCDSPSHTDRTLRPQEEDLPQVARPAGAYKNPESCGHVTPFFKDLSEGCCPSV